MVAASQNPSSETSQLSPSSAAASSSGESTVSAIATARFASRLAVARSPRPVHRRRPQARPRSSAPLSNVPERSPSAASPSSTSLMACACPSSHRRTLRGSERITGLPVRAASTASRGHRAHERIDCGRYRRHRAPRAVQRRVMRSGPKLERLKSLTIGDGERLSSLGEPERLAERHAFAGAMARLDERLHGLGLELFVLGRALRRCQRSVAGCRSGLEMMREQVDELLSTVALEAVQTNDRPRRVTGSGALAESIGTPPRAPGHGGTRAPFRPAATIGPGPRLAPGSPTPRAPR